MADEAKNKKKKESQEDFSRLIESIKKENDMLRQMIDSFKELEKKERKKTKNDPG